MVFLGFFGWVFYCQPCQGYTYRGQRRGAADSGRTDGCAIFFRTAVFALETWKAVEEADQGRRTVGVVCRLRPVEGRLVTRLVVATVHLPFGQKHFVSRLAHTGQLLAGIIPVPSGICPERLLGG